MLDYIYIDDKFPILNQLPDNFKSAAILLHPFVQMPSGWENTKRENPYQHLYPSEEEMLNLGKPVFWREMITCSGLKSYKELALALLTSIGAFKKEYRREDLADKLNSSLKPDLFYPTEDSTSVFMLDGILKILASKGASEFYFSEPIFDNSGLLNINNITSLEICDLSSSEMLLTDENMDFAFMSLYDSFTTLFFAKDENMEHIVHSMNWEIVLCDEQTCISWYLK